MSDGSAGFGGHVAQGEPENLDVKVYLKVSDGASPAWAGCLWKERAMLHMCDLPFLGSAQGNSSSSEPELQRLLQFLS